MPVSHGSLVGSEDVIDSVFKQKNIIRVESVDEMVETARTLAHPRKTITGGGLSFLGLSGGVCAFISDNRYRLGVELPQSLKEAGKD